MDQIFVHFSYLYMTHLYTLVYGWLLWLSIPLPWTLLHTCLGLDQVLIRLLYDWFPLSFVWSLTLRYRYSAKYVVAGTQTLILYKPLYIVVKPQLDLVILNKCLSIFSYLSLSSRWDWNIPLTHTLAQIEIYLSLTYTSAKYFSNEGLLI